MKPIHRIATFLTAALLSVGCGPEARAQDELDGILRHYETARAALANDQGAPVPAAAREIATLAGRATATGATQRDLRALREAAQRLASTSPSDLPALRRAFGEVSRRVVAIVRRTPALARRLHLFHCPMAEGYGEWVQPTEEIQNPYMGQRMLACGTPRGWE